MHNSYSNGHDKLNLRPFDHLPLKCDGDLHPTRANLSNDTLLIKETNCAKTVLKSMHKCRSEGLNKLSLRPFDHLTLKCDRDLQPLCTNVSNGTFTH